MLDYHSVSLWEDVTVVAILHPPVHLRVNGVSWRGPNPLPNPYEHTVDSQLRLFTLPLNTLWQSNMYVIHRKSTVGSLNRPLWNHRIPLKKIPKNDPKWHLVMFLGQGQPPSQVWPLALPVWLACSPVASGDFWPSVEWNAFRMAQSHPGTKASKTSKAAKVESKVHDLVWISLRS